MGSKYVWLVHFDWQIGAVPPIVEAYETEQQARDVVKYYGKWYPKKLQVSKFELNPSKPEYE